MAEQTGHDKDNDSPFVYPTIATGPLKARVSPVVLDGPTLNIAREEARPPWYASSWTAVIAVATPALLVLLGIGSGNSTYGGGGLLGLVFVLCLGVGWYFVWRNYRDAVADLRAAIKFRKAWKVAGRVDPTGRRSLNVSGHHLKTLHDVRVPQAAGRGIFEVVFADDMVGAAVEAADVNVGTIFFITGPDGDQIYPRTGVVPGLLQTPAVIASIVLSIGATAGFNALAGSYGALAAYERDIESATQCTATSEPMDDCLRWVDGTIVAETSGCPSPLYVAPGQPHIQASCRVLLQWGKSSQESEIRCDSADCSDTFLTDAPTNAQIELVRNYAIQVQVESFNYGSVTYRTDHWPALGSTVIILAVIFRIASILWLVWPFAHIASAAGYRVWSAAKERSGISQPPPPNTH